LATFEVVGALVVGLVIGILIGRMREPEEESTLDALKDAISRLLNAVRTLESAVGIKLLDAQVYTRTSRLKATPYNLGQLEIAADRVASRILNVVNRIGTQSAPEEEGNAQRLEEAELTRRVIEVDKAMQPNPQGAVSNVDAWYHSYPTAAGSPPPVQVSVDVVVEPSQVPLIELYNQAVDNRNRRGDFQERFHPLRIGTINASDRRRDPSLPPQYREASDGNFLAIQEPRRMDYLVVPRFDLTIKEANYEAGAIGNVFECRGWDPSLSFSRVILRRPAIFEKNGDAWNVKLPGVLDLSEGE